MPSSVSGRSPFDSDEVLDLERVDLVRRAEPSWSDDAVRRLLELLVAPLFEVVASSDSSELILEPTTKVVMATIAQMR